MENNICQTCLSNNRRLIPQEKLEDVLEEIRDLKINDKSGGICWECHCKILKYVHFKLQVRRAQDSIKYMTQESQCLSNLSITSKDYYDYKFTFNTDPLTNDDEVKIDIKLEDLIDSYENFCNDSKDNDIECIFDKKPTINEEANNVFVDLLKAEKKPTDPNDRSNFNISETVSSLEDTNSRNTDIYVSEIKTRNRVKKERYKKKDRKSKKRKPENELRVDDEELKSKFYRVTYTVEEMQKLREEKRNHPNFKKIPFKCDSCVLGFTTKENLEVHMKKKHNQNHQYTCDVCLTRLPLKRALSRHIAGHFSRYRCALCPHAAREAWAVLGHCRAKHEADGRGRIHCPHCGERASTQEELSTHVQTHHGLYCDECGEKFKGKNTLRTHKSRIHGVKREFVCEICSKMFKTKSRLESHAVSHNPTLAKKLSYCTTCNVQYKNIYVYRNHLKTSANHSERSYTCPVCNKKFVSKVYWKKHYNFYHLHKSKFNCDQCSKMFISDWRLKLHKQTQHGLSRSRDHPCTVCGKKFFTLATLRAHRLTHSAHRAFMCAHCGDTFKQRPALYTHTRLVHQREKRKAVH